MKMLTVLLAGLLVGCQSLWGSLSIPNPGNCVETPSLCLADELCDQQEQICHQALALYAAQPNLSSSKGGGSVKLFGERFLPGVRVDWDGLAVNDVALLSSTELSFSLPASQSGRWRIPINIRNSTGRSAQRADLFSYYSDSLRFEALQPLNPGISKWLTVGDFNLDGHKDVVFLSGAEPLIVFVPGVGNGTLGPALLTPAGAVTAFPRDAAALDVNGDGILDLLIAVRGEVQAFLGNGQGGFTAGASATIGLGTTRVTVLKSDRSEGRMVAVSDGDVSGRTLSTVRLLKDGTFAAPVQIGSGFATRILASGDVSGDGLDDLLVLDQTSQLRVMHSDGNGGFQTAQIVSVTSCGPNSLAVADLDHDGWQDVMLACDQGLLPLHNDQGTLNPAPLLQPTELLISGLLVADLSGDGWPDLVYGSRSSKSLLVLQADRTGGYLAPLSVYSDSTWNNTGAAFMQAADLDEDHKPDVVAGFNGGMYQLAVLRNQSP